MQGTDRTRHQIRQTLEQGITYQVRQNETEKAVAVNFTKDGHTFKGSDIARHYSYVGIVKQLEANHRQQQAAQAQKRAAQAESWFGLSSEAREAKAKLSYLNDPNGSGLDYQMKEKHYDFWIYARQETKPKPNFGFKASAYQKEEPSISRYRSSLSNARRPSSRSRLSSCG